MIITQISVFLENKTGRINDVARILGSNGINMSAFSISENAEFGIMRIIVSDVDRAAELLRNEGLGVRLTQVVCLVCGNRAGALSEIMEHMAQDNVFIEYMYAFAEGDTARIIIRPTNLERCVAIVDNYQL